MRMKRQADSDDMPIGRILSRREILALLGGSGAALLAACDRGYMTAAVTRRRARAACTTSIASLPNSCVRDPIFLTNP